MESHIRKLNVADLVDVANLHLAAFPNSTLSHLGGECVRRYYEWQLIGPHDAVALGVFDNDMLVGFCMAGVFHGALSGFLRKNKVYLSWRVLTHPWLITNTLFRQRLNIAKNILVKRPKIGASKNVPRGSTFGILSIAIDPNFQGRGFGKLLMTETESIALIRGFSRLHLTVNPENEQAVAFYYKTGWRKIPPPPEIWEGLMEKNLNIDQV